MLVPFILSTNWSACIWLECFCSHLYNI